LTMNLQHPYSNCESARGDQCEVRHCRGHQLARERRFTRRVKRLVGRRIAP
jgi:hypothetical protein